MCQSTSEAVRDRTCNFPDYAEQFRESLPFISYPALLHALNGAPLYQPTKAVPLGGTYGSLQLIDE
jgi:hypothetical protein